MEMYRNNCLNKHLKKNLKNYIVSNFIFDKKIEFNKEIKSYFFYNNYNFYFSIFILSNFWYNGIKFFINKSKIQLKMNKLIFFFSFSNFIYPSLKSFQNIYVNEKNNFFITFLVTNYFFNPIYMLTTKIYTFKQTFIIFKFSLFLKKKSHFFIHFYLNFFQIPILTKKNDE